MGVDQVSRHDHSTDVDGGGDIVPDSVNGVVKVHSADDLPDPDGNGRRVLEDDTAYKFMEFVADPNTLELGNPSPLLAPHGSLDLPDAADRDMVREN